MPLYTIQHAIPLSATQQDTLATTITEIHSKLFTTPRMFVNVSFQDVSSATIYIGGKRAHKNFITANVRHGPSRTREHYADLSRQIARAWEAAVPGQELRGFIVMGSIVAGMEAGFILPEAGGDVQWLSENWDQFVKKADDGDEEMKEMVEEVKTRGLLRSDDRTAAQRLEELLGWGDAA